MSKVTELRSLSSHHGAPCLLMDKLNGSKSFEQQTQGHHTKGPEVPPGEIGTGLGEGVAGERMSLLQKNRNESTSSQAPSHPVGQTYPPLSTDLLLFPN